MAMRVADVLGPLRRLRLVVVMKESPGAYPPGTTVGVFVPVPDALVGVRVGVFCGAPVEGSNTVTL
jgi:hypothetical protein